MLWRDLLYATRVMRQAPAITIAAAITLALGIGANTTMFSVTNGVMLRALPFSQPERLVRIWEANDKLREPFFGVSVPNMISWKEQARSFDDIGAWRAGGLNVVFDSDAERVPGLWISASLFPMMGLQPIVGRPFRSDEDHPGSPPAAIIGYELWTRRFDRDPQVIGRTLRSENGSYEIVGVAPRSAALFGQADVLPLAPDPAQDIRSNRTIQVAARLKPDASLQQAKAEMQAVAARLSSQFPDSNANWGVSMLSYFDAIVDSNVRRGLLVLQIAVGFVLLIACANVASLTLGRTETRRKEIALRVALGASRGRLMRQFLTENLLLAFLGGALGTAVGLWGVSALRTFLPASLPRTGEIGVNGTVLLFSLASTVLTGLIFGLVPSIQAAQPNLNASLKAADRGSADKHRSVRRRPLVVIQFALATMLVACASLLFQSLLNLHRSQLGFRPDHVLTAQLAIPGATYRARLTDYRRVLQEMKAAPGVSSVAVASILPLQGGNTSLPLTPVAGSALAPGDRILADWRQVSADYFQTLEIPLLRGRTFQEQDAVPGSPLVTVISEEMARRSWPGLDAVGRQISDGQVSYTVVGVAGNVRNLALNLDPAPAVYFPRLTWPSYSIAVRTQGDPYTVMPVLRQIVRHINPTLPVYGVQALDEFIDASSAQPRFNSVLLMIFATIATLMGAVGIYGVTSHSVSQRTKEIGVRMALGAQQTELIGMVIRDGMIPAGFGILVGLAGALMLGHAVASMLYGVSEHNPKTIGIVTFVLAAVALAACYLPARRATQVDPIRSLRHE